MEQIFCWWSICQQVSIYNGRGWSVNSASALVWASSCNKSIGDCTNLWNGSSWSEGAALPKILDRGGGGTSNDGISYGGRCATCTKWRCLMVKDTISFLDGTTWSEQTDIPTPSAVLLV